MTKITIDSTVIKKVIKSIDHEINAYEENDPEDGAPDHLYDSKKILEYHLAESLTQDGAELCDWLYTRHRWASLSISFSDDGVYIQHNVNWFQALHGGWLSANGQSAQEAIRNAIQMDKAIIKEYK